ncbi:TIGR04222 domain-containing membrane protein [Streptomyces sp. OZ13]|uniref:TIGR04222 domain-containing membrane protein n=1 Tax=Streptomyces sp. OZ13 TaxID=3452210 RepID=UPI003F89E26D
MDIVALAVHLAVGLSSLFLIIRVSAAQPVSPHGAANVHDVYEAAFLAGGPGRVVDAALTALHSDGRIAVGWPGVMSVVRPVAQDPVERAVFSVLPFAPNGALHTVRLHTMRSPAVQELGDVLAARGLMVPPGHSTGLARWGKVQSVVCFIGLPVAFVVTVAAFVGDTSGGSGSPFVFLLFPMLIVGALIGATQAGRARRRVTAAGRRALAAYRLAHSRTRDPAGLVALHGVRGVPDFALRRQLGAAVRVRGSAGGGAGDPSLSALYVGEAVWCAGSSPDSGGGSGCGASGGSGCGGSGGGSSCGGSSGSSCGGGSGSSS